MIQIDWLEHPAFPGRIGMTRLPGTSSGSLQDDLQAIRDSGAETLVTLNRETELNRFGSGRFPQTVGAVGLRWLHLPITDFGIPDGAFEALWIEAAPLIRSRLEGGEKVVVHCFAGLGRTGLVVARLLVEGGEPPEEAIRRVRTARPGTIQSEEQEDYVLALGRPRV